jgi:hypothetical protein
MKTLAILAGGAILFVSSPAAANTRFPLANQIVFSPTDPQLIVLRTSYGILPSHDNGKTWQYVCEEALGITSGTPADPPIGLTRNNSLLAGVSGGLNVSPDVGCNWNCIRSRAATTKEAALTRAALAITPTTRTVDLDDRHPGRPGERHGPTKAQVSWEEPMKLITITRPPPITVVKLGRNQGELVPTKTAPPSPDPPPSLS